MFLFKKRKQKAKENYVSPEEKLLGLKTLLKEEERKIDYFYDKKERVLKEEYQKRFEEENEFEKQLSFANLILEADKTTSPLTFEVLSESPYGIHYLFTRSKYSPNPYEIELDAYKNVIFLRAFHKEDKEEPLVFLKFDKIENTYQTLLWKIKCDYVTTHQVKQFLFSMLKDARERKIDTSNKYKNHFVSFYAFERTLEGESFKWNKEFNTRLLLLKKEKKQKKEELKEQFSKQIILFQKEIDEKEQVKEKLKEANQLKEKSFSFMPALDNKNKSPLLETKNEVIKDLETAQKMNKLFFRVHEFLKLSHLMDPFTKHNIKSLYEKDIHELWYGYINLDEEKQQTEKERFLSLISFIHKELDETEQKIKELDTINYETKITYLENKYKKREML